MEFNKSNNVEQLGSEYSKDSGVNSIGVAETLHYKSFSIKQFMPGYKTLLVSLAVFLGVSLSKLEAQVNDLGVMCTADVYDHLMTNGLPVGTKIVWEAASDDHILVGEGPDGLWNCILKIDQIEAVGGPILQGYVMEIEGISVGQDGIMTQGGSICESTAPALFDVFAFLPVETISFSGRKDDAGVNHVDWKVAQQVNVDRMVLERSYNGENWEVASYEQGDGNLPDEKVFSFQDAHYNRFTDNVFYRGKNEDTDGKAGYTDIITIKNEPGDKPALIGPNPLSVGQDIRVGYKDADVKVNDVMLFSVDGRMMKSQETILGNEISIDTNNLPAGVYVLTIQDNNGFLSDNIKVVIQ